MVAFSQATNLASLYMELTEQFDVPILLVMFNRPTLAIQVFQRIRQVRPRTLYVATDGPRFNHPTDVYAIQQCQEIIQLVDWPCEVRTFFRTENLGCKYGPYTAIDWFFEQVPFGIILEDDCLPDLSFFSYCRKLLLKYEHDEEVMHISGSNLCESKTWGNDSYFFTKIAHCWGWASWRRAWAYYDINMTGYPEFERSGQLNDIIAYAPSRNYFRHYFRETYAGQNTAWDYQWAWAIWVNSGLAIMPKQNLISNIGFGGTATHTTDENSEFSKLPTSPIDVDRMIHPLEVFLNKEATNQIFAQIYRLPPWWRIKLSKLKNALINNSSKS